MRREVLVGLLAAGQGEAYEACLDQIRRGVTFQISDGVLPASHYAGIYDVREAHMRREGIPTLGFRESVDRLRSLGEVPVRIGSVTVAHPPYLYLLILAADASAVVACLGVDQRFQTRSPNSGAILSCDAVGWAGDDVPS